ncbi:hypothetical protein J4479_00110 [Candidatus Woesearchaeota archaeon]|nr:hypothetical protein [Candidatus Woesearchaeota archaeon]
MNKKGLIFNGKKGYSILLTIFELLVVIAIIVMVNVKASSYAKSDPIAQKTIANDLALMIDALVGFPGNVLVEYPKDVSKYSFLVSSGKVVALNTEGANVRKESKFTLPDNYDAGGDVERKARLCVRKTTNKIFLEACP